MHSYDIYYYHYNLLIKQNYCSMLRVIIDNKIKIAISNHRTGAILTELMAHYGLTDQYYSFDYQNVHFTVMSDYVPDEKGSEQYTFVQNDLAKAAAAPNTDWM